MNSNDLIRDDSKPSIPTPPPSSKDGTASLSDGIGINSLDDVKRDAQSPTAENINVEETSAPGAVPVPDSPARVIKRNAFRDKFAARLAAAGVDPGKIPDLVAERMTTTGNQRKTPTWADPESADVKAYWHDRTDEQIEADMVKLVRQDGGAEGPTKRYSDLHERGGMAAVVEQVNVRISSIRVYVTMAVNESRRRRYERGGVPLDQRKYLVVTRGGDR